jgi:hypothetical protein
VSSWEDAKVGLGGLHFLAVQPEPDAEESNGLWLLLDKLPPNVWRVGMLLVR